jgi:glycosyltransferase involved in cell wall biosynthesis
VIEGFARGLPLVCTAVGGCADTLLHERDALLVPPRDAGALAGAVERMVHDGSLRRRLIQEGYQRARSVTFEQVGVRLLAEIEAAVARKGPAR